MSKVKFTWPEYPGVIIEVEVSPQGIIFKAASDSQEGEGKP